MNIAARSETPVLLDFAAVSQQYGRQIPALHEISLTIRAGESVALCGPNGSGKTTLLKLAAGLLSPTAGTVRLGDMLLDPRARRTAFRTVGFLFQDSDDQLFCPTVEEDVAYGPRNLELPEDEIARRVLESLSIMRIEHLATRPIHHLSGGEKKRAALAGLLAMRPRLLVLDEPTNGLDPASAHALIALLHDLRMQHGYTLVVATHEIDRIPDFATRVVILNGGGVAADGTPAEVLTDIPLLESCALEAPLITRYFFQRYAGRDIDRQTFPLTLEDAARWEAR